MPTRSARMYSLALLVGDFAVLLVAFSAAYVIRVGITGFQFDNRPLLEPGITAVDFITTALALIPIWLVVFAFLGLYSSRVYTKRLEEWGRILIGSFLGILIVLGYSFVIDEPVFPARLVAVYALVGSFVLLIVGRETMRLIRGLMFRFNRGVSRVLIIGNSAATRDIAKELSDTKRTGYHISSLAGPASVVPEGFGGVHYKTLEEALAQLDNQHITTIIQTELYDAERNQLVLSAAQERHINYSFIPGEPEFYSGKNTIDVFLGYPIISVNQTPLTGWGVIVKRLFDLVFTTVVLIILSPLLLLVMLLQKILNPGPVFFVQERLTRFSTRFGLIKFRSMRRLPGYEKLSAIDEFKAMGRDDLVAEYQEHRKVRNDPRVTWFGKFLRVTSIDELPQLFNVLTGSLSLVGPRPILPDELSLYKGKSALLHSVKSGVTGLWQVSGRSNLPFEKRVELELYYAQNWSFWLDIRILLKTLPSLLKKGAH